jgi:hypothetical protein
LWLVARFVEGGVGLPPRKNCAKIDRYVSITYRLSRLARLLARIVSASYTQSGDRIKGSAKEEI